MSLEAPALQRRLWVQILPGDHAVTIRMRLVSPPDAASFFLPGPWADHSDHASALRLGSARTEEGPCPQTLHRGERRLELATKGAEWVEFDYEVELVRRADDAQRFRPQTLGAGFFFYAPTALVLPSDDISSALTDIPVEVRVPNDWKVFSTWRAVSERPSTHTPGATTHGFVVADVQALRDAFIAASPNLKTPSVPIAGLKIGFDDSFASPRDPFVRALRTIVALYTRTLGDLGTLNALVLAPRSSSARVLWGTGRARGFVVELDRKAPLDAKTMLLIAHEALHAWNGHTLIPAPEHDADTRWFTEGVTHYLAIRAALGAKLITERAALDELAQAAERYRTNPTTFGRTGATDAQRAQYPYDRGVLIALMLDHDLRARGAPGLETWVAALVGRALEEPGWRHDARALRRELAAISPMTAQSVWDRYVLRKQLVPIDDLFDTLGLHFLSAEATRGAKLIPKEHRAPVFRSVLVKPTAPTRIAP